MSASGPSPIAPVPEPDLRSLLSNCRIFAGKADITAALVKAYGVLADAVGREPTKACCAPRCGISPSRCSSPANIWTA